VAQHDPLGPDGKSERGDSPGAAVTTAAQRLLLVDDEPAIRDLVARILTHRGYLVVTAATGNEALRLLRSNTEPFDLLITDHSMPGISGLELASRARRESPAIRVLITSALPTADLAPEVSTAALRFLQKPYAAADLFRSLEELQAP